LKKDNDKELIEGLREGGEDSQRKFVSKYYDDLFRYIFYGGKSRCRSDAEEITNDAFFRAFKAIDGFKGKCSIKTWLFRLAHNAAIDFYRSPNSRYSFVSVNENIRIQEPFGTELFSEQKHYDPTEEAVKREEREKIQECLQQLSEEHRLVITLRVINGYSTRETAEIMKKTEGAIKMLLLRAKRNWVKIIKKHPYFMDNHNDTQAVRQDESEGNGFL